MYGLFSLIESSLDATQVEELVDQHGDVLNAGIELAVVIGREARHVDRADALEHVLGYTCLNDVSARDLQFGDGQWVRAKSLDTFCPQGPCLVTRDEIPDPQRLAIRCILNGEVMQDSNTSVMIFGVAQLISFCSQAFTLEPGDVIATGTPSGVGTWRDPPVHLTPGDTVQIEIDGLEEGPHGIRQPSIDSPIVDPAIVDLAIVPGVAHLYSPARPG